MISKQSVCCWTAWKLVHLHIIIPIKRFFFAVLISLILCAEWTENINWPVLYTLLFFYLTGIFDATIFSNLPLARIWKKDDKLFASLLFFAFCSSHRKNKGEKSNLWHLDTGWHEMKYKEWRKDEIYRWRRRCRR